MIAWWLAAGFAVGCTSGGPASVLAPEQPTWENFIQGFLTQHCNKCHGPEPKSLAPNFLRTDVYDDVPGAQGAFSARARLLTRLQSVDNPMPPPTLDAPTADGIGAFARWVDQGAPMD